MIKAETIISLVVLAVIGLVIGVFLSVYPSDKQIQGSQAEKQTPANDVSASNYTTFIPMGQNICEGCHLSGKPYTPQAYTLKQHVEGGAYCLKCHTIDHNIHPMTPRDKNVTCERCHGSAVPQVPQYRNGTIACAECHGYPDALKPSNGNLVVIHRPREVTCIRCHTGSCLTCHNEIKNDTKWEKRLNHFKALLVK